MAEQKSAPSKAILEQYHAIGRRKSSVARAFLRPQGSGKIIVNQKPLEEYFASPTSCMIVRQPLEALENFLDSADLYITVKGGGISGQAGAIRLAIARALTMCGGDSIRHQMRALNFLTCDSRRVQSKNMGRRKARKKEQYRKR